MHLMQYKRIREIVDINELRSKTATIVGLGSIGSFTALLLAKNGVNLILVDFDRVSMENLSSQIYSRGDVNKYKAKVLKKFLGKLNPEIRIRIMNRRLDSASINMLDSDLVIDCTDNLDTRFLIDSYCHKKIPWIHTASIRTLGLVYVVENSLSDLYSSRISEDLCDEHGILGSAASMTASIAATQAIKILLKEDYEKNLIRFDIWNNSFDSIKINPSKRKDVEIIKLCRNNYSVNLNRKMDLNMISKKFNVTLKKENLIIVNPGVIINSNGYIIFENTSESEVKKWLKSL